MKQTLATHMWMLIILLVGCEWKPPRIPAHLLKDATVKETKHSKPLVSKSKTASTDKSIEKKRVESEKRKEGSKLQKQDLKSGKAQHEIKKVNDAKPNPTLSTSKSVIRPQRWTLKKNEATSKDLVEAQKGESSKNIEQSSSLTSDPTASEYLYTLPPNSDPHIYLKQLVVAKKVIKRKPYGVTKEFSVNVKEPVVGFVTVRNFERPQRIKFKWVYKGKVRQINTLKVGISPRWRTWKELLGKHKRKRRGEWFLEVYSDRKRLLGRTTFILD